MSHLDATVQPVGSLTARDRAAMLELFGRYYDDVDPARFQHDLDRKDDVIVLRDAEAVIRGFSTLKQLVVHDDGVDHRGIYSGDTVIEHTAWGQGVLGRAFLRYLLKARVRHPLRPLWWFLISKGYKTYLLMANNFPEHWPRYERPTPPAASRVQRAFASRLFGDDFDAERGVVRFANPCGRLRDGVAEIDAGLLATQARVRFFQDHNPEWARGDELVCLARMTWTLPAAYAWKRARKGAT